LGFRAGGNKVPVPISTDPFPLIDRKRKIYRKVAIYYINVGKFLLKLAATGDGNESNLLKEEYKLLYRGMA
jgi:hypothetical protein